MNEDQLSKIEDFFNRKHNQVSQNAVMEPSADSHLPVDSKQLAYESQIHHLDSKLTNFLAEDHCAHQKCLTMTKTKWDKFAPYAFNKLEKEKKTQTFLQLFEDFNAIKQKLNDEMNKNKQLQAKIIFFSSECAKVKTLSSLSPADRLRLEKQKDGEVSGMKLEIKRLHEKIIALTGSSHKIGSRPKTANKNKTNTQKHIVPVNENVRAELEAEKKQVRELLLIIDELKKAKYEFEDQLKQKQKNQQSSIRGERNVSKVGAQRNTESQFYEYTNELTTWKQKYNDLELIFNRAIEDKDKQIRQISTELIDLKQNQRMKSKVDRRGGHFDISESGKLQERIKDLTYQNEKLETELRRLVKMPFYQNNTQLLDQQKKLGELQVKYQQSKDELKKTNETSMKYFAELQYKSKENTMLKDENDKMKKQLRANFEKEQGKVMGTVSGQIDYDDYYRRQLALVKLEGDDPVWKKFSMINKPEFHTMTETQLREQAEKLWCSKLELLAHLEKAKVELATIKENMDSRINLYVRDKEFLEEELRMTKARLDEWMSMERINVRRDFRVYEQAGIKYDDTISVFDAEETELRELESNENYFDLYLGHINIDESMLLKNPQNKIKNISHFVSFLTVDFYNHETQHSDFAEGLIKKLGNNYSFKVEVNTYFLKYLSKNSLNLELWSPQGTATVLLGKGKIYLSEIISKATKEVSNVIRGKCQIYFNDKFLIASVEYRIRMRTPISPFIEWAESKNQFKQSSAKNALVLGKKKLLAISIERAEGLPQEMKAFIYFTVQNEDYFTEPERGSSPMWDYHCEIPVTVDEDFTDELKQRYFEFKVFDDEKDMDDDVYGIAKASLTPLVETVDSLSLNLDIENHRGERLGKLKVKVEWLNS